MKRFLVLILLFKPALCNAQMARTRAAADGPVDAAFKATRLVLLPTTKNYDAGTLNFSIMHSFDEVRTGGDDLWGLDGSANIRFGLDYGISDRLSVGFGRSRIGKFYDLRAKYVAVEQTTSDKIPVTVALQSTMAATTIPMAFSGAYNNVHRLSYSHLLLVSRKISEQITIQLSPMLVHFNRVSPGSPNTLGAVALSGRAKITKRTALIGEYIPVLTKKFQGTRNAFSLGAEFETGGHVFQLFFTNSSGLIEPQAIAATNAGFFKTNLFGQFRFGFNVHRIFWF
jgi:hypothetical protein